MVWITLWTVKISMLSFVFMAMTGYERIKKWRQKSKKNASYKTRHTKKMRQMYRKMFLLGEITYAKVPKSYRYWKNRPAIKLDGISQS